MDSLVKVPHRAKKEQVGFGDYSFCQKQECPTLRATRESRAGEQ